jgi:hypothetical protein
MLEGAPRRSRAACTALALASVLYLAGCGTMPRRPEDAVVQSLHTVAILPVAEAGARSAPPPPTPATGGGAGGDILPGLLGTPVGLALVFVAAPFVLGKAIADSAAATDEPRTFEPELSSPAWPTVDLAQAAVSKLDATGLHQARLANGYLRVAGVSAAFTNPITRWYAEDVSTIDYAATGLGTFDGVLEIGTSLWQYPDSYGVLTVSMRLVDPRTRQVVGRARHWTLETLTVTTSYFSSRVSEKEFQQVVKARGDELLSACLEDLGLTSK